MDSIVNVSINIEVDLFWLPVNSVGVIVMREAVINIESVSGVVGRSVQGSIDMARVSADPLHNVDLSTCRPALLRDAVSEKPEGGPNALTSGEDGSHLELSIHDGELSLSLHSC